MATKKAVAKKPAAQERIAKEYRHLKYQSPTFTLKVGRKSSLLIFDEVAGVNRAIRHCPGEKSIFVEEQSKDAVVVPIIFLHGLLDTKETDVITQKFLDNHPSNGILFEVIDNESDATDIAGIEELRLDVKQAIRVKAKEDAGIEELRLITAVLISDVSAASKMTAPELKNALYDLVETNLGRFVNDEGEVSIFDNVEIQREALTQHSFNSGVIQVSADGSKVMWSDNKATICQVPVGQSHLDFFTKFLGTEQGLQVAVEISKR